MKLKTPKLCAAQKHFVSLGFAAATVPKLTVCRRAQELFLTFLVERRLAEPPRSALMLAQPTGNKCHFFSSSLKTFFTNSHRFLPLVLIHFQKRANPGDSWWRTGRFRGRPAWSPAGGLLSTRAAPGFRNPLRYMHAVAPWGGKMRRVITEDQDVCFNLSNQFCPQFFSSFLFYGVPCKLVKPAKCQ